MKAWVVAIPVALVVSTVVAVSRGRMVTHSTTGLQQHYAAAFAGDSDSAWESTAADTE